MINVMMPDLQTPDLLLTIIAPQHIIETLLSNLVAKEILS
jgi:hypothetical protein